MSEDTFSSIWLIGLIGVTTLGVVIDVTWRTRHRLRTGEWPDTEFYFAEVGLIIGFFWMLIGFMLLVISPVLIWHVYCKLIDRIAKDPAA